MNKDQKKPSDDPLRPIIDAIKLEIREEILAEVRADMAASRAETVPGKVVLSLSEVGRRYGAGRIALKQMIRSGRLRAIERPCRGGRLGQFLHLADCERVLAGRKM